MTARELISASLRKLGALASGETLGAAEATDGLSALNSMLASWSAEPLIINAVTRESFALVPSQKIYTMGSGGNFNTTRPETIQSALLQVSTTTPVIELPVHIMNQAQYAAIALKDTQSSIPTYLYAEGTYPLETLNIWPVPTLAYNLILYSSKLLTSFATLNDVVSLPPGYERAIIHNFAVEIAPEYGRSVGPELAQIALDSKATIKRMNDKPLFLQVDDAIRAKPTRFNWYTGESQ